jgi:hypothetical protein
MNLLDIVASIEDKKQARPWAMLYKQTLKDYDHAGCPGKLHAQYLNIQDFDEQAGVWWDPPLNVELQDDLVSLMQPNGAFKDMEQWKKLLGEENMRRAF